MPLAEHMRLDPCRIKAELLQLPVAKQLYDKQGQKMHETIEVDLSLGRLLEKNRLKSYSGGFTLRTKYTCDDAIMIFLYRVPC